MKRQGMQLACVPVTRRHLPDHSSGYFACSGFDTFLLSGSFIDATDPDIAAFREARDKWIPYADGASEGRRKKLPPTGSVLAMRSAKTPATNSRAQPYVSPPSPASK